MRNLLTSLKRILSETSLIKTSYNTNILIFTFVRHLYFFILRVARNVLPTDNTVVEHELAEGKKGALLEHARQIQS